MDVRILWRFPLEARDAKGETSRTAVATLARGIAVAKDGSFFVVSMPAEGSVADDAVKGELGFHLAEGIQLAEQVLADSQQAVTRPGAMLFEPDAAEAMKDFAGGGIA